MEYDDPKFIKLVGEVNKKLELGSSVGPMLLMPWMVRVFPKQFFNLDCFTEVLKSFNNYAQVTDNYLFSSKVHFLENFLYKLGSHRWS